MKFDIGFFIALFVEVGFGLTFFYIAPLWVPVAYCAGLFFTHLVWGFDYDL